MKYEGKCCGTCGWCLLDENTSPYCSEPRLAAEAYPYKQHLLTMLGRCPEGYWKSK
jgi:hypothetical protein